MVAGQILQGSLVFTFPFYFYSFLSISIQPQLLLHHAAYHVLFMYLFISQHNKKQ